MQLQKKNFSVPDETKPFPQGKVEFVHMDGRTLGRVTFESGWKWSESLKPSVGTESCQMLHVNYQLSGKLHVRMDDGTEMEFGPGDVSIIPPGHDGWVVGDEPVVAMDVSGVDRFPTKA